MRKQAGLLHCVAAGILLGGCAENTSRYAPVARSLPSGKTCKDIHSELKAMDRRGVQSYVERASQGESLPPQQREAANRYTKLLDQYLHARCHV